MLIHDFYHNLPQLETARLVLRKFCPDDATNVYAYASDEMVTRFLRWYPHASPTASRAYLAEVLLTYKNGGDSPWGIQLKDTKKVIGSIHLMQVSETHRKAEVGVVLSQTYWHQGFATEALQCVMRFVFTNLNLNRLEALPLIENTPAHRLFERVGFTKEGVLNDYLYQKDAFRSFVLYAMLRKKYEEEQHIAKSTSTSN